MDPGTVAKIIVPWLNSKSDLEAKVNSTLKALLCYMCKSFYQLVG